jgi:predicted outer membrane repeat protein
MSTKLLIAVFVGFVAVATVTSADTIVVDWTGAGDYTLIQDGINAADEGDTVLVMPGTYAGPGNRALNFIGTDRVLRSSGGPGSVTIDCGNVTRGFSFQASETAACIVDGFTITNGVASVGAGMYINSSSPSIRNCIITGNVAVDWGGAFYCTSTAGPAFTYCTFSNNEASYGGGATCTSGTTPSFEWCTFSDNTSVAGGGGVYLNGCSPHFQNCNFDNNRVTDAYARGGGMHLTEGASPTLSECSFDGNTAPQYGGAIVMHLSSEPYFYGVWFTGNSSEYGGAVSMYGSISPSFADCRFADNTSVYSGGAVHSSDGAVPEFSGCVFDGNTAGATGGALHFEYLSTPVLDNCTLYGNSAPAGSGVWCDDNFTLTNSIIAFGVTGEAVYCDGDPPYPSCSDIYGNPGGNWVGCLAGLDLVDNNLSEDPLFCDAMNGDFTIDVASPCTANNAPSCGLIGAWDVECDSPVKAESWGAIKAMYR